MYWKWSMTRDCCTWLPSSRLPRGSSITGDQGWYQGLRLRDSFVSDSVLGDIMPWIWMQVKCQGWFWSFVHYWEHIPVRSVIQSSSNSWGFIEIDLPRLWSLVFPIIVFLFIFPSTYTLLLVPLNVSLPFLPKWVVGPSCLASTSCLPLYLAMERVLILRFPPFFLFSLHLPTSSRTILMLHSHSWDICDFTWSL